MQENNFESRIRKEMEEFEIVPGADVWGRVAVNLSEERKKRRFLFFLLSFAILAGSAGLYVYLQPITPDHVELISKTDKPADLSGTQKEEGSDKKQSPASVNNPSQKGEAAGTHSPAKTQNKGIKNKIISSSPGNVRSNSRNETADYKSVLTVNQSRQKKELAVAVKELVQAPVIDLPGKASDQEKLKGDIEIKKEVPLQTETPVTPVSDSKKDSVAAIIVSGNKAIKIRSNRNWTTGITVFGGISDNVSGIDLFPSTKADNSNFSFSSVTSGQGNNRVNNFTYSSGKAYGIGFYIQKEVSFKLAFSVGANYQYRSANSRVGGRNNTSQSLFDSVSQSSTTIRSSYAIGQNVKYTNKYYFIELPLTAVIRLNKNQKKKIALTAGVTPGYLIASQALNFNLRQNIHYEDNKQFKKWLISLQTAIQFTLFNSTSYSISAGPELQYGTNNMVKTGTATPQHLLSGGVRLNVGFNKK